MQRFFSIFISVFILNLFLATASGENLPKYIEPTSDFVTSHIAWSKPSCRKPLKVLFITHRMAAREIIEVSERFDIERQVFLTKNTDTFACDVPQGPSWLYADEASSSELLRAKLAQDYDIIVIGQIKWEILPDWARTAILNKVQNGTGLIWRVKGRLPAPISKALDETPVEGPKLDGYPFVGLPAFRRFETAEAFRDNFFRFGQLGKGRILVIDRFPYNKEGIGRTIQILTPECTEKFPDIYWLHYDYYQALLGHLFNWVTGTIPEVRIRLPESILRFPIPQQPMRTVRFSIMSEVDAAFDLEFVLRESSYGDILAASTQTSVSLKHGENIIPFPVKGIPAGNYFADLWIKKEGKTVNYGSIFLNVVAESGIEKIVLARSYFETNEIVSGSVIFKNCGPEAKLLVRQVDNFGRVVAEETLPVSGNRVDFQFKSYSPLTILQTVEANLLIGAETVDLKRQRFTYCDLPLTEDVPVMTCQTYFGDSYHCLSLADQCRKSGITSWLTWPNNDGKQIMIGSAALKDIRLAPIVYGRGMAKTVSNIFVDAGHQLPARKTQYGMARNPCLTDPEYINAARAVYSDGGEFWRPFSPLYYCLGDECMFSPHGSKDDLCFSETCIADFRKFVQKEYDTLEKLNAEYGTNYAGFDEVLPVSLNQLKDSPQLVPVWIDHRRHMDTVWANYMAGARQTIRSQAPGARVGYEGSGETGHGSENGSLTATDYYQLALAMDANTTYYFPFQLDCVRDLSAPGTLFSGGCFGAFTAMWRAGHDPMTQRWWLWNGLLRGANVVSLYNAFNDGHVGNSFIAPDFSFLDFFSSGALEEIKVLNSGIGKLLVSASRENDNTAVLYSPSSMLLSSVSEGVPDFWNSADGTPIIFLEALRQYRMVASAQVENNELAKGKYQALYLPCAVAISDKEASEILSFARKGGMVIADMRPGIADQHGKARKKGVLDELFGVEQVTSHAPMLNLDSTGLYANPAKGTNRSSMVTARVEVTEPATGNLGIKGALPPLRLDSSLKLAGGKALGKAGEVPALIVNDYGKGKGILLNMLLVDYLQSPKWSISRFATVEMAEKTTALLQNLFRLAALEPAVTLCRYVPGIKVHRLSSGSERIYGLVWDAQPFLPGAAILEPWARDANEAQSGAEGLAKGATRKEIVALKLPEKVHLYDVFAGKYEGFVDAVQRELVPGKVCLFAALPYKPSALEIKAEASKNKIGQEVQILADLKDTDKTGVHIFTLKFFGPDGRALDYYGRNIQAIGGKAKYSLTLALNEQPGRWKVKATDVVTGLSAETLFEVVK